jgi:hypothetical protein
MNNQSSGSGGGSPKVQAMKRPAPKNVSGKGPAADSSKGKSTSIASVAGLKSGATDGPIVAKSVKGPHD